MVLCYRNLILHPIPCPYKLLTEYRLEFASCLKDSHIYNSFFPYYLINNQEISKLFQKNGLGYLPITDTHISPPFSYPCDAL